MHTPNPCAKALMFQMIEDIEKIIELLFHLFNVTFPRFWGILILRSCFISQSVIFGRPKIAKFMLGFHGPTQLHVAAL